MTHGGARPGAGRKPKFDRRVSVHVYMDADMRQRFLSMVEYIKEVNDDRSISASDVLLNLAIHWMMASVPEDDYGRWAAENREWLRENQPLEYERLGMRSDGEPDVSDMQKVIDGVAEACQIILDILQPVAERFIALGQEIYDTLYAAYVADGAIYGETQEGMLRWLEESREIARLRSEAQRLEEHHAMLRDFKEATDKPS